jgi:hypothetical protein
MTDCPRKLAHANAQTWRSLAEIQRNVLRVSCRCCARIVEMQKADAIRLYGREAVWKDVGQRCSTTRASTATRRHEEDGCRKCAKAGQRPAAKLAWQPRHPRTDP